MWIIVLVFALAAISVAYQYYQSHKLETSQKIYTSTVTLHVGLLSATHAQSYSDYITTSNTLADEFATGPILASAPFATQIIHQIQNDMQTIRQRYGANASLGSWQDAALITKAISTSHAHSLLAVSANWTTEAGAWAIAHAVGEVCEKHMPSYLNYQIVTPTAQGGDYLTAGASVIIEATQPMVVNSGTQVLRKSQLLAILFVGLIIGFALAFLIEYLDDCIHNSDEVTQLLQLPLYGAIPPAPLNQERLLPNRISSSLDSSQREPVS